MPGNSETKTEQSRRDLVAVKVISDVPATLTPRILDNTKAFFSADGSDRHVHQTSVITLWFLLVPMIVLCRTPVLFPPTPVWHFVPKPASKHRDARTSL
jgi:hypothetical protein